MDKPLVAYPLPIPVQVKKGETLQWCACGRSSTQPWCDGSHVGSGMAPVAYTATRNKIVFFCGCKHSTKGPICDGSHSALEGYKR